jgi:tRNA 2-thiouridine synthesizing protein D
MTQRPTLTLVLMDAPFEQARTVTAMRLLDIAARRGYRLHVFAYEGAVALPFARQQPHANPVHGHDLPEEDHPLSSEWIAALMRTAREHGGSLDWINCGLCVDERGVGEAIDGCRRGTPAELLKCALASDNTLVIGTR